MILHLTIAVLLVFIDWNFSVLPWNLATAIVGYWVMFKSGQLKAEQAGEGAASGIDWRRRWVEIVAAVILFVMPVGFFWGWVDHGYANVLYSDFVPRGLITSELQLREIAGWAPVHVPFPYERRTHRQFFEAVAQDGDKLHIHDPRLALDDLYFVLAAEGARAISEEEFFSADGNSVAGVAIDDFHARFWLRKRGVIKQRWYRDVATGESSDLISHSYTLESENYSVQTLQLLAGLPNLVQLQLAGCPVTDSDLVIIGRLKRLQGIGLSGTAVKDEGLRHLEDLKDLQRIETQDTQISPAGLQRLTQQLRQ